MGTSALQASLSLRGRALATQDEEFHSLCDELSRKLLERMRCNVVKENFMPRTAPYEALDSQIAQVRRLLYLTTAKVRESFPWSLQGPVDSSGLDDSHRDEFNQWLSNIVKWPGQPSPRREQRVATVLAILLEVHASLPSGPTSEAWQAFTAACMRYESYGSLRDGLLPLPRRKLCDMFGRPHGLLFYATQFDYCSPVVKRYARLDMRNRRSDVPLPYLSEELIGDGAYGDVYKVEIAEGHVQTMSRESIDSHYSENPVIYARKDIALRSRKDENLLEEWDVIQLIRERHNRHPWDHHLMQTLACFHFTDKISLFMRLAERGDLAEFMAQEPRPVYPENQRYLERVVDIASALAYLHHHVKDRAGNAVVCFHLDLKPENILVVSDSESGESVFKLADFSISRIKETSTTKEYNLTTNYADPREQRASRAQQGPVIVTTKSRLGDASSCVAPEGLSGGRVSEKSDVWGYGCVLAIFLSWLCQGPAGVQNFTDERVQQSDGKHDRFFTTHAMNHTQHSISSAADTWLAELCLQTTNLEQNSMYQAACECLLRSMLLVETHARADMKHIQEELAHLAHGKTPELAQAELQEHMPVLNSRPDSSEPLAEVAKKRQVAGAVPTRSAMNDAIIARIHHEPSLDMNMRYGSLDRMNMQELMQTYTSHDGKDIFFQFADRVEAISTMSDGQWYRRLTLTAGNHTLKRIFVTRKCVFLIPHSPTFKLFCFRISQLFSLSADRAYIIEGPMRQPEYLLVDALNDNVLLACYNTDHDYIDISSYLLLLSVPTKRSAGMIQCIAAHHIGTFHNTKHNAKGYRLRTAQQLMIHFADSRLYLAQEVVGSLEIVILSYLVSKMEPDECWPRRIIRWTQADLYTRQASGHHEMSLPHPWLTSALLCTLVRLAISCSISTNDIIEAALTPSSPFNLTLASFGANRPISVHLVFAVGKRLYVVFRHESGRHIYVIVLLIESWPQFRTLETFALELPAHIDQFKSLLLYPSAVTDTPHLMLIDSTGKRSLINLRAQSIVRRVMEETRS